MYRIDRFIEVVTLMGYDYGSLYPLLGMTTDRLYSNQFTPERLKYALSVLDIDNINEISDYIMGEIDSCYIKERNDISKKYNDDSKIKVKIKKDNLLNLLNLAGYSAEVINTFLRTKNLINRIYSIEDIFYSDACTLCYLLRCTSKDIFVGNYNIKAKRYIMEQDKFVLTEHFFKEKLTKEFYTMAGIPQWGLRPETLVSADLISILEAAFIRCYKKEFQKNFVQKNKFSITKLV